MEAEKRKSEKAAMSNQDWTISRAYTNNLMKNNFVRRFFLAPGSTDFPNKAKEMNDKYTAEVNLKCGQSPKRKINFDTLNQGSPSKIRKTNTFSENLNYWKKKIELTEPQNMPTDSALRFSKTKTSKHSHKHLNKVEVVSWQNSPGGFDDDLTNYDAHN